MIVDLHAHYAIHLIPRARGGVLRLLRSRSGRVRARERLRAALTGVAGLFFNYRSPLSGPRVRMSYLREGGVGVVLSVVISTFDEIDVAHGSRPRSGYVDAIADQMRTVEEDVSSRHRHAAAVARNPAEMRAAIDASKVALVHCVEGGFHLGSDPDEVRRTVARLAGLGVAYVTVAHLLWRDVATNAPGLSPLLPDALYRRLFPQPSEGLSDLGVAAIEAMVEQGVLVDLTHMSARALDDTFALLDRLDPARAVPVMATHAGVRFGDKQIMLDAATVRRIAERDGVVGLIFSEDRLCDGLGCPMLRSLRPPWNARARFDESFAVFCRHVDRLRELTGSHRHVAIGSDLDGFIKPTLPGLDDMRDMSALERALRDRYGDGDGELICSANALRVLETSWRGAERAA